MVTVSFANATEKPLDFQVEPWAAIEVIPAGAAFAIHYPAPPDRDDTSFVEIHEAMVVFWCEGSTYEVDVNERRVLT